MKITNEVTDYISKNLDVLKIIKMNSQTRMNIPRASKYIDISPSMFISKCNDEYKDKQYLNNLSAFIFLDTEKSIDCVRFLIVNSNGSYVNNSISKHIYLDNFLKQYQASILDYCMGIKDSINSDADRLKIEKVELTSLYSIIQIPDTLLARLSKVEKDIDDELEVGIAKLKDCITILDKFNKMVDEVIASKEAWKGLLDIMNKK